MNTHMPAELYNRLAAHLLEDGSREGLFLANEVKDLYGASAQRKYADPLIEADPNYPDRPQHLDFARMAAAAERIDELAGTTSEDFSPAQAIGVDDSSLRYMALNRMNSGLGALGPIALLISPESVMAASWLDGFAVGQEYQLRGGSRPAETGDAGDKEGSE
ncbi:hypothetical protein SEA_FREGLEY_97 [Microbacterium phage Fregley]|nr:hypothetical protein SEA_FREGLEY_97 [Microbacterium phage Fregley]